MGFSILIGSFLTLALTVAATPRPQLLVQQNPYFALRANAPHEPWNDRPVVILPTSQRLGLENFTVHPETAPVKFIPIRVPNEENVTYALRGSVGDDLSNTPWLTAVISPSTHTVSMHIVYLPSPLQVSFDMNPEACPDGYQCAADQWTFANDGDDGFVDLGFAGFKGKWVPFKDARSEGWTLYWKGNAGLHHAIQLDLVPLDGSGDLVRS